MSEDGSLPADWKEEQFKVVDGGSGKFGLWNPKHKRFLQMTGHGIGRAGEAADGKLQTGWTWERFRAMDGGSGQIGIYCDGHRRFIKMSHSKALERSRKIDHLPSGWDSEQFRVVVPGPSPPTPAPTKSRTASVHMTNSTAIRQAVTNFTNVAFRGQGSTCSSSVDGVESDRKCVGAFDGVYAEFAFVPVGTSLSARFFWWEVGHELITRAWIKVTFKTAVPIQYMGLMTRPCPCERWDSAEVQSESDSIRVKLDEVAQYSLYDLNMGSTSYVKFSPLSTKSKMKPGVLELEFWTATTGALVKTCPHNEYIAGAAASEVCQDEWNRYTIGNSEAAHLGPSLVLNDSSNFSAVFNKFNKEVSLIVSTAGWDNSVLGFRVKRYPVRVSPYGDTRIQVQGDHYNAWVGHALLVRTCVMVKWTSCNENAVPNCRVKKQCKVENLDTVISDGFFANHHIKQYAEAAKEGMRRVCDSQCVMH